MSSAQGHEKTTVSLDKFETSTREFSQATADAKDGHDDEHARSVWDAFKLYPSACAWSILLSTAVVMEGYDLVLLGNFYALPQFVARYGIKGPDGVANIPPSWQSGLSNGAQCGEIIGLAINGWASERFGYKKTMLVSLFLMICFIFIPFFAKSLEVLLIGEILQGIPWGVFQTLTCSYAAEVAPMQLRPFLTTYVNICWVLGQLLASGILRALLNREDEWAYRIPFAIQWMWPAPIMLGVLFAPESPWWLVRHGRIDDAKAVVRRLTSSVNTEFDVDKNVALMVYTNEQEKAAVAGTSYLDCFRGIDRRRTEIACVTWIIQNASGSAFMNYSTYFLQQSGFAVDEAFSLTIGQYAIGFVGTVLSWFLMHRIGRRTIYVTGLSIMTCLLFIIGCLGLAPHNQSAVRAVGGMLLVFTFVYDCSIGPVAYSVVSEIGSTRLRPKTVALARNAYNIFGFINNSAMPRFLNKDALNWGAKTGFFWFGMAALCLLWAYFRLPEPKDRTALELEKLFEAKVSARKFSTTHIDIFENERQRQLDQAPAEPLPSQPHAQTQAPIA